jgi:hypothetical protein
MKDVFDLALQANSNNPIKTVAARTAPNQLLRERANGQTAAQWLKPHTSSSRSPGAG